MGIIYQGWAYTVAPILVSTIFRLFTFLANIWDHSLTVIKEMWGVAALRILAGMTVISSLLYGLYRAITAVYMLMSKAVALMTGLDANLNSAPDLHTSSVGETLAFANHFLPLDELMLALILLATLYVACMSYRFLKSWLPTLS